MAEREKKMTRNVVFLLGVVVGVFNLSCARAFARESEAPLTKATRQVVYSPNGKFIAISDPREERTTVFSIKQNMSDREKVWSYPGVFQNFHLSESGQVIAATVLDWNRVHLQERTLAAMKATVALTFFHSDGKTVDLTLDRLVTDPRKLKASDFKDDYNWGHVVGFDEDDLFIVDTHERHRLAIDPKTAAKVSDEDHNAKK
jgi:hypothetical protein